MFEYLEPFPKIIVTGPQRSGTTIIARAIEHDLGRQYIDELAISGIDYYKFHILVHNVDSFVMQAPGMCRFVHEAGIHPEVAVVLCRRDIGDIIASQERIGWEWEEFEKIRFGYKGNRPIAEVKYAFWDQHQKDIIKNAFEVDYESMRDHPLWVPAEQRADFAKRQWQVEDAGIPV